MSGLERLLLSEVESLHRQREELARKTDEAWSYVERLAVESQKLQVGEPVEPVYCIFWSRDCDLCESAGRYKFNTLAGYMLWRQAFLDSGEGPCWVHECTPEEYAEHEPYTHDVAAEMAGY